MVQAPDYRLNPASYSAVKINITNPQVNVANTLSEKSAVGDYNGVLINIDNPEVNTAPKAIYDYPKADVPVTYEMAQINHIQLPQGFPIAYQSSDVFKSEEESDLISSHDDIGIVDAEEIEIVDEEEPEESFVVPAFNYTTIEAEKGIVDKIVEKQEPVISKNEEIKPEAVETKSEGKEVEIKRPEIIPEEPIVPEVDINLVTSNLANADYDIQAIQMEEIARKTLENPQDAIPYIVREVFTGLIDITNKDTSNLTPPSNEQIEARQKIIENFMTDSINKNSKSDKKLTLPHEITEKEIALANQISPLEQAERNKEYALYTIALLTRVYVNEVEKHTGNVIPLTDLPGTAAMTDSLRYSINPAVKIAAIDALNHISRPEYKDELTSLLTLAQADSDKEVAEYASQVISNINV